MAMLMLSLHTSLGADATNGKDEEEMPCEPAGDGAIATGSVASCKEFWRSFVRSSPVMDWIENGYRMLWTELSPERREYVNAPTACEHRDFVSGAVKEMMTTGAVTLLPEGEKPWVVSPLGVAPKKGTNKFRLTVNMRYANRHLGEKKFKMGGLKNMADLAEKGDHAVSYDLMSGYYHA
jgi:hypothetical protein